MADPAGPGLLARARSVVAWCRLPARVRREIRQDRLGPDRQDPGIELAVGEAMRWLARAQDRSASADGGVARDYSLIDGWSPSYPETTGYIIPTCFAFARLTDDPSYHTRARRMADWLVSIQLPDGAFQGGRIDQVPVRPVTFNTGQILFGLVAATTCAGPEYRESMRRAADWLTGTQDADGAWRRFPTPFARPGEKTYETHVAWALMEAERVEPGRGYGDAALANVRWALSRQQANGWFADCCLSDPARPLTHTIGYALRGVVEAYRLSRDDVFLAAARRTADGLVGVVRPDGMLSGRLNPDWSPAVSWSCLTGQVQIAHSLLMLHQWTGDPRYLDTGRRANRFVRRTVSLTGAEGTRGGIKGSFPVDGAYGRFQYLNWAAKFFVDANLLEAQHRDGG